MSSLGVYAIWDDHDFGLNDSFGGPEIEEPTWKGYPAEREAIWTHELRLSDLSH